ncbi:MAG: stage II sporulation protein R [Peptococcaceae bacterium]|nr:MAG: stage II sporulation protein R [Peptococcaceae bacterium]
MTLLRPVKVGIATLFLLAITFLPATAREQAVPAYNPDNLIRLHVVANSDSAADQALKQKVRDEIVRAVGPDFSKTRDAAGARQVAEADLGYIHAVASRVVRAEGKNYPVSVSLGRYAFPTKAYDYFVLPAGDYEAVRVVIGRGDGANWWCVLFPPLCFVDLSREAVPVSGSVGAGAAFDAGTPAASLKNHEGMGGLGENVERTGVSPGGEGVSVYGAPAEPSGITFRFKIVELWRRVF